MTDIAKLDALVQAIADAETRAGRPITKDEALAVARAFDGRCDATIGFVARHIGSFSADIRFARAAYAAGRASAESRVAELEGALRPVVAQSTSQEWMAETGAAFADIASGKSRDWHAGYDAAVSRARAAMKGGA
jgi:hypothetical protein